MSGELGAGRAGIVSRGVAFTIDFVVVFIGYPLIIMGIGVVQGLVQFEEPEYPDLPGWLTATVYLVWVVGYFSVSWFATGRTVGQALLGLRVVSRGRLALGPVRALGRTWVMLVTVFVVGPLWLLFSRSRLAIHDRLLHTEVVHDTADRREEVSVTIASAAEGQPK